MHKSIQILLMLLLAMMISPTWAEEDTPANTKAIYYAIEEPFTINFLNQSEQKARYLQIKVTLMAHNQEIIDSAASNLPMLQDALRTLFSAQTSENVNSVEGRKRLQTASLDTVKTILEEETGRDNLDAVYFTSFVLQ
ncbi:MAG: flagellar basal body-associated FliL family protein [Pseudomonadota bacterium]|nr:flagellar basal body-associated FliL family protein [Pseudomonadota bacterium]MDO7710974.1 flagellar basal body-associated FliL family protein [Pseudomonadota bacterium]